MTTNSPRWDAPDNIVTHIPETNPPHPLLPGEFYMAVGGQAMVGRKAVGFGLLWDVRGAVKVLRLDGDPYRLARHARRNPPISQYRLMRFPDRAVSTVESWLEL